MEKAVLNAILILSFIVASVSALHEPDFLKDHFSGSPEAEYSFNSRHRRVARNSHRIGQYEHRFVEIPNSERTPDNVLFKTLITDQEKDPDSGTYLVNVDGRDKLRAFKWSPNHTAYSFVLDDNVYYATPGEPPIKVTNREEDGLIHGSFDWMYNEEIFGRSNIRDGAMWISPSGQYLAYASRHANSSKEIMQTTYSIEDKYDYNYNMEYPKSGENRIAEYTVSIFNVEQNKSVTMNVELSDPNAFHYLFAVSWVTLHDKELLLATWANRWQNVTTMTLCDYESGTCKLIREYNYEYAQWATPEDYANTIHSNSSIFVIQPNPVDDNSWQHIAKLTITPKFQLDSVSFLPSGAYDVHQILEYRAKEDIVIYDAQAPNPWNLQAYASPAGEKSLLKTDQCVSCGHSNCTYQIVQVSQEEELKLDVYCAGPGPHFETVFYPFASPNDEFYYEIASAIQSRIVAQSNNEDQHEWKIEKFDLGNGFEAIAQIYEGDLTLPSVPVTLYVYGGPNMNQVTDQYDAYPKPIGYEHAIVHIDVRGSGGRGWNYRSQVYGRLVTVEVEDTYKAMRMVLAKYPRLDKNRVGVFGWSYGGTMTTGLVEVSPNGFFKCAVAVAPVTNFALYDATYTERYMGDTPLSFYTDLSLNVSKFAHTKFMLVHGMRDDNVHFQNSALLIEALQQADIPFELMVYPNQDHSISRGVGHHLRNLFNRFFEDCYA